MDDIFSTELNDNINNLIDKLIDETENSFKSENLDKKIEFNILLLDYFRRIGKTSKDYAEVIPESFDYLNFDSKIRILKDCLNRDCLIEKSKVYISMLEGSIEVNYYQDPSKYL